MADDGDLAGAVPFGDSGHEDVVDGFKITLTNLQPGDRFLLQPVALAASQMQALLQDPRDLAAAAPLVATTGAANKGSVKVNALQVTAVPLRSAWQSVLAEAP